MSAPFPKGRYSARSTRCWPADWPVSITGSGWGPVALADFKSVMPCDERGRWVRLPRTPAKQIIAASLEIGPDSDINGIWGPFSSPKCPRTYTLACQLTKNGHQDSQVVFQGEFGSPTSPPLTASAPRRGSPVLRICAWLDCAPRAGASRYASGELSGPMYRSDHGSNYEHESLAILPVEALKNYSPAGIPLNGRICQR